MKVELDTITDYGLKQKDVIAIQKIFEGYTEIEQAIIYGSRAKGNYKAASDIDITLKGEKLNIQTLNKIANQLDDLLLPYTFDLSIHQQISNGELLEHIKRVGKIFW